MSDGSSRIRNIEAILFDLHFTLTEVTEDMISLTRKVSAGTGIDLSEFTDDEIQQAVEKSDEWFKSYMIENDVEIHFGSEIEHWIEFNRRMLEALGLGNFSENTLLSLEREWKHQLKSWEVLRPDAFDTLLELKKRGFKLGLCTRRPDDPTELLKEWRIFDLFLTLQWTFVPGYAKPSPYTLILAAIEIGMNPTRCAFVGNRVESDIMAATRAGMIPVLITWADTEEAKKVPEGTHIIGELSELLELLQKPSE